MGQMIGRIVSLSEECAEVCIVDTQSACSNCSSCPKKTGTKDIIKVAGLNKVKAGQLVILRDNRNWINKNKIISLIGGFIFGVILSEVFSKIIVFRTYRSEYDFIGGGIMVVIMIILIKITKPNYCLRMELYGEKKREHN
ncbi:hypothetical protein KsCSTR_32240 [Candidatus Kuenenia stuttgartiensis]|jgi:hypothetical protein|nr:MULTISPECIES: hypothetical protein [Kuenenia]MBW7943564.1 hypothetical protein [Candidatus Kuenenia stuttgartiensis]MBZ0190932.1 SoxR reducing system RseC family protein [Candidatus Kuenenia stuttgartiensis]MCF6152078.1 hypothetical protein [Candidatus Kuenenia stuttgartiensis]MCL4726821.1 hypothetical protein [Candidatus Kuenenia stuttgartiensis]MCZ7621303.1 SoxR reducing system RseC family protein [Candidatus Kuenenia sp.]